MELFWWFFTIVLFAVGLIGTVLPVFPGTTIILAARDHSPDDARAGEKHRLGNDRCPGAADAGVVRARFSRRLFRREIFRRNEMGNVRRDARSASRIFFGIAGLFVGPVIGAVAGEFIAGKRMIDAGRAGWGSLLGNLGAMIAKLIIALVMIAIFFMTVPLPF